MGTKKIFYKLWKFGTKFWEINYFLEIIVRARSASEIIKNRLSGTEGSEFIF